MRSIRGTKLPLDCGEAALEVCDPPHEVAFFHGRAG